MELPWSSVPVVKSLPFGTTFRISPSATVSVKVSGGGGFMAGCARADNTITMVACTAGVIRRAPGKLSLTTCFPCGSPHRCDVIHHLFQRLQGQRTRDRNARLWARLRGPREPSLYMQTKLPNHEHPGAS